MPIATPEPGSAACLRQLPFAGRALRCLSAILTAILTASGPALSQPTLYFRSAPDGEVLQDSLLSFQVAPIAPGTSMPEDCALWSSPSPAGNRLAGHDTKVEVETSTAPDGGRVLRMRPADSGAAGPKLGLGFHYLVAACGTDTSSAGADASSAGDSAAAVTPEIPILVVTRQAASILAPKALETSARPAISWSAVPGVPAYHLLLSDQALEIDPAGGKVDGASVIWQAITTGTSILYGTPDPSGNFAGVAAPPLSPGVAYNLVVLNNYDGRSALATSSKAQALKLFSLQAPAAPLSKPRNLEPAQGRILSVSTDTAIAFRWTSSRSASGPANTYELFLYSLEEQDGSEILIPILSREATDTTARLDAKRSLLSKRYLWKVFAKGADGSGVAGDTTSFAYRNDVQTLSLAVTGPGAPGGTVPLGDVRIAVTPLDGGADPLPLFTPSTGRVDKVLAQGSYALAFAKDGHLSQSRTVTLSASGPAEVSVLLPAAEGRITGRAVDAGGLGIDNVQVTAASADRSVTGRTDAQGRFLLGVGAGAHAVSFAKADYLPPADTVVTLAAGGTAELGAVALRRPEGVLSGTVANDKGLPLSGCQVLIRTAAGAQVRSLLTDDKGAFTALLAPGAYLVSATRTGFAGEERAVQLAGAAALSLRLVPGASVLRGRVELRSHPVTGAAVAVPLSGAAVELRNLSTGVSRKVETDLRGEYAFSADTGSFLLKAASPARARPESALVRIAVPKSTVAHDLALEGFAYVLGTLTPVPAPPSPLDPAAARVSLLRLPGLEPAISAAGMAAGSAAAGGAIAFSLEGVPDGSYQLACGVPGYGLAAEPQVTVRDGIWITDLALTLQPVSKYVTFTLQRGPAPIGGSVRLLAPQRTEVRAGARLGPAAPGTWVLGAVPDSLPVIPLSRLAFALPAAGAADTAVSLPFPFAHAPPSAPLAFRNRAVELSLETLIRPDSAWIIYGYSGNGAPSDTFRVPEGQLSGPANAPRILRFDPGAQGGLLTYYFILRSGASTYANDAPDRRFRAQVAPSGELAFLRIASGDSLALPALSRVAIDVHAYDAAGRRLDSAVDARGKVTWSLDGVASARAETYRGRVLTVATGAAPVPSAASAKRGAAAAWDNLAVTVALDGVERTLTLPAKVVPGRINKLVLASALGETPAIPSPAPFALFVSAFDTTTVPPLALVPSPAFALDPPEAGEVRGLEVVLDPRFIGPLRVLARHVNPDGTRVETELGAQRDSSSRGLNVGQTVGAAAAARLLVHDREFELLVPDSLLAAGSQAVLRMYRRGVAKSFASSPTEALAGRLYEISNPSGASLRKPLRINLGVPAEFRGRENALRRFDAGSLAWETSSDTAAAADTTVFGGESLAAGIARLDGSYYGLLARSRPLSAGALEIIPNPFSPLVTAVRDGNTEPGARIRFRPESDESAEVTVTIRVYNMDGEPVRTLIDHRTVPKAPVDFYWDGKADGGRWARNGRYLIKISLSATGSRKTRHLVKPVVVFR